MNGTARKSSSVKLEPPLGTSNATNAIKPPHQRSSSSRPRRADNHSRQGISIATVLPAAARKRRAHEQPAVSRTAVEGESGEHDDDRGPAEPVADLHAREAEAELEAQRSCFIDLCGAGAETRSSSARARDADGWSAGTLDTKAHNERGTSANPTRSTYRSC